MDQAAQLQERHQLGPIHSAPDADHPSSQADRGLLEERDLDAPTRRGFLRRHLPLTALIVLTIVLYGLGLTHSRGVFGDSFHHLANGIFVHDAASLPSEALRDPLRFGIQYYRHFPAVNLGYYPPAFAIFQASLMFVFGVSSVTGQLAVFVTALLMALLSFAWMRLRFSPWWAAATAAAIVATPQLVFWGRDIMLEVPALACMIGAMWGFERTLRSDRPTWSAAMACAVFTTLALWTKQHTLLLLGVYAVSIIATRRFKLLISPPVLVAMLVITLAAAGVVAMTLRIGGTAVGHTAGFTKAHIAERFNVEQWVYYLRVLPAIVTWPTLVLSALAIVCVWRGREPYVSPLLAWVVLFYVMHAYFRAQALRYGCLWIPPFCVLAAIGLKHFSMLLPLRWSPRRGARPLPVGALLLAAWTSSTIVRGALVSTPPLPSVYQRAANDLADRMPPFTCMTFFPDRPARIAVCYRLAVEERCGPGQDIYSFGRIVRAKHIKRHLRDQASAPDALADLLGDWNIKYILTETPRPIDLLVGDDEIARLVDGLVAGDHYVEVRRYPVRLPTGELPVRTMVLYERVGHMVFNPDAAPPLDLGRIGLTMDTRALVHTP